MKVSYVEFEMPLQTAREPRDFHLEIGRIPQLYRRMNRARDARRE
jgi:hypothetical protein